MKPIKAWAVVDRTGVIIESRGPDDLWLNTTYESLRNAQRSSRAKGWRIKEPCKVVRVEIREVAPKKGKAKK